MAGLARFSVSLEEDLLKAFDAFSNREGYPTRSEAVKHLIRNALVEKQWQAKGKVAGAVMVVYDHHKKDIVRKLLNLQHDHGETIITTQHVHLDHDNCLEMITVKGEALQIQDLVSAIRSLKGIKHSSLLMTTAGKTLP